MNFTYQLVSTGVTVLVLLASACSEPVKLSPHDSHRLWFQRENKSDAVDAKSVIVVKDTTATLRIAKAELRQFRLASKVEMLLDGEDSLGCDGFRVETQGGEVTIHACSAVGLLYSAYDLMRKQYTGTTAIESYSSVPSYDLRMLNHWDNLDGTIERGYAGKSLWHWSGVSTEDIQLYKEYARANASIGINAVVLNNVNASPEILSVNLLPKVAALADIFRPYGIRVFLSVNFSSPMELAGLKTADPLSTPVRHWWKDKVREIYSHIPDFGGFLVKANSEGLPGPLDFGRSHSDGANMLADALRPYGGTVLWRAFVYSPSDADRAKQAYLEFQPLDGEFADNVIIQIKNGPIDFQPREPFSPLFGALHKTQMAVELQITQEYTGASNHICYLPVMWQEALLSDTYRNGPGSTIAAVTETKLPGIRQSAIAGVANIGDSRDWCGNTMAQANWYAFGRMAWSTTLSADSIATEWIRQTMPDIPQHSESTLRDMLMESREAVVDYMMPLGLHHIFAWGHHYGPEPWCDIAGAREDWMPRYYHCADKEGIGSRRNMEGSQAVLQYNEPLASQYANIETCPEEYLLWFHHVDWDRRMKSGRTLWDELCMHYDRGLTMTDHFLASWKRMQPYIDEKLWEEVNEKLLIQRDDARWWHDGCLLYFQQFSNKAIPQNTVYKLEEMQKFHINITNFENPARGYRGEKLQ